MANDMPAGARDPREIERVVRSLNVLDIDVSQLDERLSRGRAIDAGRAAICIIDIECCIIDCSNCAEDQETVILPETPGRLKGFAFKVPRPGADPGAPVYYLPEIDLRAAFRMGHRAVRVPGRFVEGRVLGIAGEMFSASALAKTGTAPTAAVIALVPKNTTAAG